ncbi:hypothetical protein, partial [Zavarzinella formosa]|uniref:hypothetical protein n=1 Tax=Zavarzinella formosa TaxID=360055 RepID=UPI0005937F48
LGADINATRVRAAGGRAFPDTSFPLDGPHEDLSLAISVGNRGPVVGRAALAVSRKLPHTMSRGHLALLGRVVQLNIDSQTH